MKAHLLLTIVVAGCAGVASLAAENKPVQPEAAVLQPSQPADERTTADVREILAQSVNQAVTPGHFTTMVEMLAKPNRDKLLENPAEKPAPGDKLNRIITQFRADFHEKYHQDFDFRAELLKQVPVKAGSNPRTVTVSLEDTRPAKSDGAAPANGALSEGPTLVLVNEGPQNSRPEGALWRINIPNEISAEQLKDNLTRHLQKLDDEKSTWGNDVNAAAKMAASEVFQSLTDSSLASED